MSRRLSWYGALLASACAGLYSSAAEAQTPVFTVDRLFMAGAPDDGIGVWRPEMGVKTRVFGQFGLGAAVNPLRTDNFVDFRQREETLKGNPLTFQLNSYLNVGAQIYDRALVQVSFPLVLFQAGNATTNTRSELEKDPRFKDHVDQLLFPKNQAVALKPFAPGDLRLEGRFRIHSFKLPNDAQLKLGVLGAVYLPTGNRFSFAGDGKASGLAGIGAEYDAKKYIIALNAGVRIRPFANLHELNVSNEFTYAIAGYVPFKDGTVRLGAEIFGSTGIDPGTLPMGCYATNRTCNRRNAGDLDASPLEWNINGRAYFTKKKQVFAGLSVGSRLNGGYSPDFRGVAVIGGFFSLGDTDPNAPAVLWDNDRDTDKDGIPDIVDMCPNDAEDRKGAAQNDGCPQLPDRDGDGIPDVSDKCPDQPEDFDGVDDRDGCPEHDADKDGIADAVDHCPKEPGASDVDPKKNGCPHFIVRVDAEIQLMKQVEFKFDSYEILPVSYPILDEVVRLLQVNKEIKVVSVEGHTDNQGTEEYNDKLSKDRAGAVVDYLVRHGVEKPRLTSNGFGLTKPIATNDTDEGRQRNRRVEFHIKSQTIEGR